MCQKSIILLFSLILFTTPAVLCQEEINDELSEAYKAQKEIGVIDKELEKIEKQAKIAELKKKMAKDLKEAQAIQSAGVESVSSGYQQVDAISGEVSANPQIEVKMILTSAESKKALLKTDSEISIFKVGDTLTNGWEVREIDKESVLFKKGEELKRYRIAIW